MPLEEKKAKARFGGARRGVFLNFWAKKIRKSGPQNGGDFWPHVWSAYNKYTLEGPQIEC